MQGDVSKTEILTWLAWYRAAGATLDVGDAPTDWFALSQKPQVAARPASGAPSPSPSSGRDQARAPSRRSIHRAPIAVPPDVRPVVPPGSSDNDPQAAREAAGAAGDLTALHETLKGFKGCGLRKTAKSLCFYRGAAQARLMIIGEAPGRDEDLQGVPFVGRAGQLLNKMLAAIDLGEDDVHITNLVYWRPPGNRTPTPDEVETCRPFLERQIELVRPDVLLMLGRPAANHLFGVTEGIKRLRGKWLNYKPKALQSDSDVPIRAMATFHPAYLLRTPVAKRDSWTDLQRIRQALREMDQAE